MIKCCISASQGFQVGMGAFFKGIKLQLSNLLVSFIVTYYYEMKHLNFLWSQILGFLLNISLVLNAAC